MHRVIKGLLVVGLLGCNVGDWEVSPKGAADGATDGRRAADRGTPDRGPNVTPPPAQEGDVTTCVFMDSTGTTKHNCGVATVYPGPLAFDCWGTSSCSVKVTAAQGTELTWKACYGYAYTLIDGKPDTIGFDCAPGGSGSIEMVSCTFVGSTKKEACFTTGLPGPFRCSGVGSCKVAVLTKPGTKLTWTSTCGGSQQTVVGSGGDALSFSCK